MSFQTIFAASFYYLILTPFLKLNLLRKVLALISESLISERLLAVLVKICNKMVVWGLSGNSNDLS